MSWRTEANAALTVISKLEDGWDSYGAYAPRSDCIARAREILSKVTSRPHINPMRDGGIQFEWECGERYLEFCISDEETFYYENGAVEFEGSLASLLAVYTILREIL